MDKQLTANRQAVALSPDGTRIVYAANAQLYLRSMSDFEATAIPGTASGDKSGLFARRPVAGFWAESALKRIAISGGAATTICQVGPAPFGISWNSSGILFSLAGTAIMRVSPDGGKPELLVDLNNTKDLAARSATAARRRYAALHARRANRCGHRSMERSAGHRAVAADGRAQATAGGWIGCAVRVDRPYRVCIGGNAIRGAVRPLQARCHGRSGVRCGGGTARTRIGWHVVRVLPVRLLVYVPGPVGSQQQDLVLFDRKGGVEALNLPHARYDFPRVSPDGKRIVFETTDAEEAVVSVYDLSRASSVRRLTFGGNNRFPIWSADGSRVTFQSDRDGDPAIFWQPADGGTAERLTMPEPGRSHTPESWSPDGQGTAVQRDEELRLIALDLLAQGSESQAVWRCERFGDSDRRNVLARRPLGSRTRSDNSGWAKVKCTCSHFHQPARNIR